MAKTYLQVHPKGNLLVVDQAKSIGGSWAKERLYPGLKTNNVFGSYEFGDFPMVAERYNANPLGHIPGEVVHAYFCDLARQYGIDSRLRLETRVQCAVLQEDGRWIIMLQSVDEQQRRETALIATKLVMATGLTSDAYIPTFSGQEHFDAPILHSVQLGSEAGILASCNDVVVLGGNKSAWDVCYNAARLGSHVHMIIRPSGGGPSYLWPKSFSWGPFSLSLAILSATRAFVAFDPTPYGKMGPLGSLRSFLHRTFIGQKVCHLLWNQLDSHIKKLNGYCSLPELKKLEPWTTPFWMGNSLSIQNYDTSWFDLVRQGKIQIHIADVTSLSRAQVHLSTQEVLDADALVCCTGWKDESTVQVSSSSLPAGKELNTNLKDTNSKFMAAELQINTNIPYLSTLSRRTANAPAVHDHVLEHHPLRHDLYRMVVPSQRIFLEKKNLAYIGSHSSVHAVLVAQAQALWITAFFQDKVKHLMPSDINFEAVEYDSIVEGIYGKLRRPRECGGAAGKHGDLVFDSLPYVDTLLRELGLLPRRKKNWWKELFEVYLPRDYRGIVEEWRKADLDISRTSS